MARPYNFLIMAHDLFNRYLWLVDTIRRYGRITRADIDELWRRSPYSNGNPLPRRTFCNYREAAQELFKIEIKCDPVTFEYYIDEDGGEAVTEWLLNAAATHEVISQSRDMADRIFVEDVPSAREFLAPVIDALRNHRRIQFTYQPYYRTVPATGIVLEALPPALVCGGAACRAEAHQDLRPRPHHRPETLTRDLPSRPGL